MPDTSMSFDEFERFLVAPPMPWRSDDLHRLYENAMSESTARMADRLNFGCAGPIQGRLAPTLVIVDDLSFDATPLDLGLHPSMSVDQLPIDLRPDDCWRCDAAVAATDTGLCADCHTVLGAHAPGSG